MDTRQDARTTTTRRHDRTAARATTVGLAVGAALAVWGLTRAAGLDVATPQMGDTPAAGLAPLQVLAASAVAALAGWGLLAVLERWTARAHAVWVATAVVVLALSLGGPLSGEGITALDRAALVAMHLAVAAVLVPGLPRAGRRTPTAGPPQPTADENEREHAR